MAVVVEIRKKKTPPGMRPGPARDFRQGLAAELERLLPADAFAFAVEGEDGQNPAGLPGIVIVHRGRALGLEPASTPHRRLSPRQRQVFARLTAAGMRIEVARSFGEAVARLGEMGVALGRPDSLSRQVADLFRLAQKRKTS